MIKNWVRIVFRRRVFVIFLIIVQIAFIFFLIARTEKEFRYANYVMEAISVIVCVYIVNKKEKSAYKMTWIFLILLFPLFGGAIYVFFHTQSSPKKLRRQMAEVDSYLKLFSLPAKDALLELAAENMECLPQARYLQNQAKFPVYRRTQTLFFNSGESFLDKVLEELKKAEKYIFLEFFILRHGKMLNPIIEILEKKAREGLDVRIIYDSLGCFVTLPPNFDKHLEKKGIKCLVFNPFKPILSSLQNNRDHRKIIVIDGKTAFTGGLNLADEYINAEERFGHWKDAAIMIHGEAAWGLTLIFLQMWNLGKKLPEDITSLNPWKDAAPVESDGYVQPYADSPIDSENVGEHVYIQIINNAKEYVYINTPYLVVDDNLLSALSLSAKSGVDVRIITPHR